MGLVVLIVSVCANLGLLTGASGGVDAALIAPLPALFVAGGYERLTTVDAERV
ncbi:hypothetical protein [Streptomyces sp. NPDC057302]|uniref:hypothetical protein n=1 Tax=Streptomyces sp. NPDC057302 TaxID=3346094 RepID=UPI003638F0BE